MGTVVFYGGVSDVEAGCQDDLDALATERDHDMSVMFENDRNYSGVLPDATRSTLRRASYWRMMMANLLPTATLVTDIHDKLAPQPSPNNAAHLICAQDPVRAQAVADAVMHVWSIARMVAQSHGLRFIAVLQPNAFLARARLDQVALDPKFGAQFIAVYRRLEDMIARQNADWIVDMTDALDGLKDDYVFIDYCHLSANGNRAMAQALRPKNTLMGLDGFPAPIAFGRASSGHQAK